MTISLKTKVFFFKKNNVYIYLNPPNFHPAHKPIKLFDYSFDRFYEWTFKDLIEK